MPFELPEELTSPEWVGFLHANCWGGNYQYVLDNLMDPLPATYLHGDTYTLSGGSKSDKIKVKEGTHGFEVFPEAQLGENFDWISFNDTGGYWCRVEIPYPPSAGSGGILRIITFVTPIDGNSTRIHFWRQRQSSGWQRDMWAFVYKDAAGGLCQSRPLTESNRGRKPSRLAGTRKSLSA